MCAPPIIWAATSENRSSGLPTRSDTKRAAQLLNMARALKFWIYEVEGLYYPCSENKGADQLCGYREADLRLCFRICKNPVFSRRGSFVISTCTSSPLETQFSISIHLTSMLILLYNLSHEIVKVLNLLIQQLARLSLEN